MAAYKSVPSFAKGAAMKIKLNSKQISFLRGLAHKLEPVVTIGNNGVSEGVIKELEFTLKTFELIKIKVRCDDQDELLALVESVSESVKATKVQVIGHTLILYRRSPEPKIAVPGLPMPEVKIEEKALPLRKASGPKVYGKSAPKRAEKLKRWGRLSRVKPKSDSPRSAAPTPTRGEGRGATGRGFSRGSR